MQRCKNMNEETRLILYSLKWVIERDTFNEELRKEMDKDICNKIVDLVNPIKEESIREKTEDAFSEQNEINGQQIKKDDNLMGKSSGDTKIESGSKNHPKDFQSDNQSADNLFANQKQDEVKKDE